MAFATIQYFSRSLLKASSVNVVFPDDPGVRRPWAAFYLLHGLIRRPDDLDAADEHRALRRGQAAGGGDA